MPPRPKRVRPEVTIESQSRKRAATIIAKRMGAPSKKTRSLYWTVLELLTTLANLPLDLIEIVTRYLRTFAADDICVSLGSCIQWCSIAYSGQCVLAIEPAESGPNLTLFPIGVHSSRPIYSEGINHKVWFVISFQRSDFTVIRAQGRVANIGTHPRHKIELLSVPSDPDDDDFDPRLPTLGYAVFTSCELVPNIPTLLLTTSLRSFRLESIELIPEMARILSLD